MVEILRSKMIKLCKNISKILKYVDKYFLQKLVGKLIVYKPKSI